MHPLKVVHGRRPKDGTFVLGGLPKDRWQAVPALSSTGAES